MIVFEHTTTTSFQTLICSPPISSSRLMQSYVTHRHAIETPLLLLKGWIITSPLHLASQVCGVANGGPIPGVMSVFKSSQWCS
jgi:hypothetical protein